MIDSEFISEAVACYYTFKNSYILIAGVDAKQNLIINAEISYINKPISFVARQLLSYSLPVWTNTHEPLRYSLGTWFGGELNFYQESEIEPLNDLYESLIVEERLKAPGLTLSQSLEPCLKILIKALQEDLCSEPADNFFTSVGEIREVYKIWDGY